jgi:hypothetical protein
VAGNRGTEGQAGQDHVVTRRREVPMREGQLWATASIRLAAPARTHARERRGLEHAVPGAGRAGSDGELDNWNSASRKWCVLLSVGHLHGAAFVVRFALQEMFFF